MIADVFLQNTWHSTHALQEKWCSTHDCKQIIHVSLYEISPLISMPNLYNNIISIGWRQLIVGGAMHDMSASIEYSPVKNSYTIHKNVTLIMWNQLHKILQCMEEIVHEMWCDDYGNILMCNGFCKISLSYAAYTIETFEAKHLPYNSTILKRKKTGKYIWYM